MSLRALVRATKENKQCLNEASKAFANQYASQRLDFSTDDPDSLGILQYFGHFIQSSKFYFANGENCDPHKTSNYRQLLHHAHQHRKSVVDFQIMGELCGIHLFDKIRDPFVKAEVAVINQRNVTFEKYDKPSLCEMFRNVRKLVLNIGSLDDPTFLDCEFDLLDDLTVGGAILDDAFDETFQNFLIKNARIQHITFTSPTKQRIFQLVRKCLRNLKHVSIFDKVLDDDVRNEIFIPSVRTLEINFKSGFDCEPPMGITFGGDELQELTLHCDMLDGNYKYFNTLYRYPGVTSLNVGYNLNDRDLLKMVGRFPLLMKADFLYLYADGDTVLKFVEKCDRLKEMNCSFGDHILTQRTAFDLREKFGVKSVEMNTDDNARLRFERNDSHSTLVTSGLVNMFVVVHICRAFFF